MKLISFHIDRNKDMLINKERGRVYLTGQITNHIEIDEACDFILDHESKINLVVNSSGGSMGLAVQLINTIAAAKKEKAIYCIVNGRAFSAAANIALSCAQLHLTPGSSLFFHGPQITTEEGQDSLVNFKNHIEYLSNAGNFLNNLCMPFLTKEEVNLINQGGEIYLAWNDQSLPERLKLHFN